MHTLPCAPRRLPISARILSRISILQATGSTLTLIWISQMRLNVERPRSTSENGPGVLCPERNCRNGSGDRLSNQPFLGECCSGMHRRTEGGHADEWRYDWRSRLTALGLPGANAVRLFDIQQNLWNESGSFSQLHCRT